MATYKVDIVSRHGKLHSVFFPADGPKGDPLTNPAQDSIEDILAGLDKEIEKNKLDEEADSIIWRGIAYDNFSQLRREIKMANY